jgi:hypothetical protein
MPVLTSDTACALALGCSSYGRTAPVTHPMPSVSLLPPVVSVGGVRPPDPFILYGVYQLLATFAVLIVLRIGDGRHTFTRPIGCCRSSALLLVAQVRTSGRRRESRAPHVDIQRASRRALPCYDAPTQTSVVVFVIYALKWTAIYQRDLLPEAALPQVDALVALLP